MRADHTERTFNQLAVARLALPQRGLGGALRRDVDARGDDERNLPLRVGERRSRPRDAAQATVTIQPLILIDSREVSRAKALERVDRLRNILARDQFVPRVAAHQRGKVIAGGSLARAVEAND